MSYQVILKDDGTYQVCKDGFPVTGASVKRISFPSVVTHHQHGAVHHISGPCVATINVPGVGIKEDVPVVSE